MLFETKFSTNVSIKLFWLYYFSMSLMCLTMEGVPIAVMYVAMYEKFQIYMINDILKSMVVDNRNTENWKLIRDEPYQQHIYQLLTVCIKRHHLIKHLKKCYKTSQIVLGQDGI
ncbi:hypothetical protein BDFB_005820 [Asbolus verrucosus]|uniref:7tm 6 domain containing protein n=1 Tax=Asbolus verrucosus TaxID=1661398 RepID=A0A482VDZ8_ASBVE|nr:hypothetical protein BDFB_005820 [Asbolus verrucosus]